MKKRLLIFVTVLALLSSISICAFADEFGNNNELYIPDAAIDMDYASVDDGMVFDYADILTDSEEADISLKLENIYDKYNFGAYVLIVDSIGANSTVAYADDFYDYSGLGYGPNHDGCILLIAVNSRDWYISTTGYGITALTDAGIQYIGKDMVRYLSDDNWSDGIMQYAIDVDDFVAQAKTGTPYDVDNLPAEKKTAGETVKGILIALVVSLIIAFVVISSIKKSYKPVRFNKNASNYLVPGSLQITGSYDNFLYSNVTQTKIESSSSSGGSSTHVGSSGTSHGGGGGKF